MNDRVFGVLMRTIMGGAMAIGGALASVQAAPAILAQAAPPAQPAPAQPAPNPPVPNNGTTALPGDAALAGNLAIAKTGPGRVHLSVTGHALTTRDDLEKYLAFRAAALTLRQGFDWFELVEHRGKGDKVPREKADPAGPAFSFRLESWRPQWRYKTKDSPAWKSWSPFSGAAFGVDPKTVTDYEVSADIVMHKGATDGHTPQDFDAAPLSDYLGNLVTAPK